MDFEITDVITAEDNSEMYKGLYSYNLSKIEDKNPRKLGVYHRVDGKILGGVVGVTHGNWLEIDYLWVSDELRGSGIGSELLAAAEREAVNRNCKYSFLYTFGFQAPGFYAKYGYREVFTLENFPLTGSRHYFVKNLV